MNRAHCSGDEDCLSDLDLAGKGLLWTAMGAHKGPLFLFSLPSVPYLVYWVTS